MTPAVMELASGIAADLQRRLPDHTGLQRPMGH